MFSVLIIFFFQAEDGIRGDLVTGVQTCALPISRLAHAGQTRQSGDPYISHPLAVAEILAGWHLDGQTLMAALLHDVTEDTSITKDEKIGRASCRERV